MSNPNIVLSVWQLTLMAVVPLALLIGWLAIVLTVGKDTLVRDLTVTGVTPLPSAALPSAALPSAAAEAPWISPASPRAAGWPPSPALTPSSPG